ncbi:MAG: esterase family protein, partial [Fusobacteriales bacterium]|nr:esterase family protein [Fusobacteriales bacterium]
NVIIPESDEIFTGQFNKNLKTLYLLHGLGNDYSTYMRYTSIERYALKKNLAVVMPSADHSFYTDMEYGHKYFTFISEEIPQFIRNVFPFSDKREDNFIAGHSMGGYGSFKTALLKPESFAAAASLSGALDINHFFIEGPKNGFNTKSIYGDIKTPENTDNDLFYLIKKHAENSTVLPKLYQTCGTEDFLYDDNVRFRNLAQKLKLPLTYKESPGGHEWEFWDNAVKEVIDWLPID